MTRTGCGYEAGARRRRSALGYAEADPSDDVGGADAAAKMAILARLAFDAPVHIDDVRYEGITSDHQRRHRATRASSGSSLKLIGTAERLPDGISVRVHPAFLYGGHPLASVSGSFNAVTVESEAITEITMSGPGAGGTQTASAVLGDVVARDHGRQRRRPALEPAADRRGRHLARSTCIMEVDDRPGVLAQIAQLLGDGGASIKSVVQRGLGERAQLMMVTHPLAQLAPRARARRDRASSTLVRSPPRAISVIDEEFE